MYSGFHNFPNAFQWQWGITPNSLNVTITITFKENQYAYCGSIVLEGMFSFPELYLERTSFSGLQEVVNGINNFTIMNWISVDDCLKGFSVTNNDMLRAFEFSCHDCYFNNVPKILFSDNLLARISFNYSEFHFCNLEHIGGQMAISNGLFMNSTFYSQEWLQINNSRFENSTVSIHGGNGNLILIGNIFSNAYTGLRISRSFGFQNEISGNMFTYNTWGIVFVDNLFSPVPYENILSQIQAHPTSSAVINEPPQNLQQISNLTSYNTMENNDFGVLVIDESKDLVINFNNVLNNRRYNLVNFRRAALNAKNNYWGVQTSVAITSRLWDAHNLGTMGAITFTPWSTNRY